MRRAKRAKHQSDPSWIPDQFQTKQAPRSWIQNKKVRVREWGKDKSQTLLTWRNTAFHSTPLLGFLNILSNRTKFKLPMIPMIPPTPITTLRPPPNRSQSPRLRRSRSLHRSPPGTTCCSPVAVELVAAVFLMLWLLRISILHPILSLANRYDYSFCFSLDYAILMNLIFVAKISNYALNSQFISHYNNIVMSLPIKFSSWGFVGVKKIVLMWFSWKLKKSCDDNNCTSHWSENCREEKMKISLF